MSCKLIQTQETVQQFLETAFGGRLTTEIAGLNKDNLNRLLQTFPPVWQCELAGFLYKKSDSSLKMIVNYNMGTIYHHLGHVALTYTDPTFTLKELT